MKALNRILLGVVLGVASAQASVNLGSLPLWFEAGADGRYLAHAQDSEFAISTTGAEFTLAQPGKPVEKVQMTFVGGNASATLAGTQPMAGKVNYLLGSDSSAWQVGLPTFSRVQLHQVYPGVDVVYYGNQQRMEYDFNLAAGVKPEAIAIRFDGAQKVSVNADQQLVVQLQGGQIIQHAPVAYQLSGGQSHPVTAHYRVINNQTVTFAVEHYDATLPLVIDPVLSYSTYFGGNSGETIWAVAVNQLDDSVFVAGQTLSIQVSNKIPFAVSGALQTNFHGGKILGDAFVAKFDASGTNLLYCTYLGGSADDAAYAIAVDLAGDAYVGGTTDSTNFPMASTPNYISTGAYKPSAYQGNKLSGVYNKNAASYSSDAFIAELAPDGGSLIYSTYLGGNAADAIFGLSVDPDGNAYATGITFSTNFPITEFAVQPKLACSNNFYLNANSFVARVSADGTSLDYSTFLGGTNYDVGRSIYYEPIQKQVYAAGWTLSTNFPYFNGLTNCTRLDGWRTNSHPAGDGWVARFSVEGNDWPLVYSTFLGSSNYDQATGITADSTGNAYVVGWTTSTNFPVARENTNQISFTSFVHTNNTGFIVATNAFLTQIGWDETNAYVRYSQVFGSRAITVANGVALNLDGSSVYVAGYSSATNIPVSTNLLLNITNNLGGLLKSTNRGGFDVFVMAMPTDFSAIKYFTYLGGKKNDVAKGLALDYEGNAVVVGQTLSTNFPAFEPWFDSSVYPTNGVWPKTAIWSTNYPVLHHILVGTNDAFVTKIITAPSN